MAESTRIGVFAAGSLVDGLRAIGAEFERRFLDVEVSSRFARADHIRQDIVEAAPVNVFAPARQLA